MHAFVTWSARDRLNSTCYAVAGVSFACSQAVACLCGLCAVPPRPDKGGWPQCSLNVINITSAMLLCLSMQQATLFCLTMWEDEVRSSWEPALEHRAEVSALLVGTWEQPYPTQAVVFLLLTNPPKNCRLLSMFQSSNCLQDQNEFCMYEGPGGALFDSCEALDFIARLGHRPWFG